MLGLIALNCHYCLNGNKLSGFVFSLCLCVCRFFPLRELALHLAFWLLCKVKGKAIPVTGREGP
jgi:hypothetical protein